jgi:HAD superfamily hydrolase (TIGR01509 family)
MKWIRQFQLFLFDFDGLLVNTEHLHFQAYINMLAYRGLKLDWSFARFCEMAHINATALKEGLYAEFPDLDSNWDQLYEEKKAAYLDLLVTGKVELMPGAEALLKELATAGIRRCVVTNSMLEQTIAIRFQHDVLKTIPNWITREDYSKPKPDPECYLRAIEMYGEEGGRIIGFEDSVRGILALKGTPALPVLVCPSHHPLLEMASEGEVFHFETLSSIRDEDLLADREPS